MRIQRLNKKRFLGDLCAYGHEYKRTGKSVRYEGCRTCCSCNALSVERSKKRHQEYRIANKEKMRKYQEGYRAARKKARES